MPHFTKSMETPAGLMNFYFNRIITAAGVRYHVSLIDRGGRNIIFHMEQREGRWFVVENQVDLYWLADVEKKLSNIIIEHRAATQL